MKIDSCILFLRANNHVFVNFLTFFERLIELAKKKYQKRGHYILITLRIWGQYWAELIGKKVFEYRNLSKITRKLINVQGRYNIYGLTVWTRPSFDICYSCVACGRPRGRWNFDFEPNLLNRPDIVEKRCTAPDDDWLYTFAKKEWIILLLLMLYILDVTK